MTGDQRERLRSDLHHDVARRARDAGDLGPLLADGDQTLGAADGDLRGRRGEGVVRLAALRVQDLEVQRALRERDLVLAGEPLAA